jgi:hypothetical protein
MHPGYQHLLGDLLTRHQNAETGVMHLFTESNQYGRMALLIGELTHLSLHTRRGAEVAELLRQSAIRSHRFEADALLPPMEELPPTPVLLAALGAAPPAANPSTTAPAAHASAPASSAAAAGPLIDPEALSLIEAELAREVGPMATSLIAENLRGCSDAMSLVHKLTEMLLPQEGEKFQLRVRELLRAQQAL